MEETRTKLGEFITFTQKLVIIVLCFIIGWGIIFQKPKQIIITKPVKVIEKQINTVKREVEVAGKQLEVTKKTLHEYKVTYDTVNIIKYQDSVIVIQDTIITKLTEVTKLQDSVITQLKFDNKRLKRQRNIAVVIGAIATSIAILK